MKTSTAIRPAPEFVRLSGVQCLASSKVRESLDLAHFGAIIWPTSTFNTRFDCLLKHRSGRGVTLLSWTHSQNNAIIGSTFIIRRAGR